MAYKDNVSALYGQWRVNCSAAYQSIKLDDKIQALKWFMTSHPVTQNTSTATTEIPWTSSMLLNSVSVFLSKIEIIPSQVLALLTTTRFLNCQSTVVLPGLEVLPGWKQSRCIHQYDSVPLSNWVSQYEHKNLNKSCSTMRTSREWEVIDYVAHAHSLGFMAHQGNPSVLRRWPFERSDGSSALNVYGNQNCS